MPCVRLKHARLCFSCASCECNLCTSAFLCDANRVCWLTLLLGLHHPLPPAGKENLHEGLPLHHHHLAPARAPAAEPSFGLVPAPAPAAYKQTPKAHTHAPAAEPPFGYTPSAPHRGTFYSSARRATLTKDDGLFLAGVSPEVLAFNLVGRTHVIETRAPLSAQECMFYPTLP